MKNGKTHQDKIGSGPLCGSCKEEFWYDPISTEEYPYGSYHSFRSDLPAYGVANKDYMFGDKMRVMKGNGAGNKELFDFVNGNYEYEKGGRGWHLKDDLDESIRRAIHKVLR